MIHANRLSIENTGLIYFVRQNSPEKEQEIPFTGKNFLDSLRGTPARTHLGQIQSASAYSIKCS
jgi:hypothetical protein